MTAEAPEGASGIATVVLARALARWRGSNESLAEVSGVDAMTREHARQLMLTAMAETQWLIRELDGLLGHLARQAAENGATHEDRAAAVGLKKEAARRRWSWPARK